MAAGRQKKRRLTMETGRLPIRPMKESDERDRIMIDQIIRRENGLSESELYKELGILTKDRDRWEESIPYH